MEYYLEGNLYDHIGVEKKKLKRYKYLLQNI